MPKFVSDILAKAGLTVDGVVTLNSTATGQTPLANDNSTKLATTAWVRNFVTPYTLPAATTSTLGGVIVGNGIAVDVNGVISINIDSVTAVRSEYTQTATTGQTVFTVPNGYTPGLLDIYLNGVHLGPTTYTATNGTTFTLNDAAVAGDIIDIYVFSPLLDGVIISTDQIVEGSTNLYYTNARARAAISGTPGRIEYTAGVIDLATSGATAGSYGSSSAIPTITVDAFGRITSISTTPVSIVTNLAGLSDVALTSVANNNILKYNSATSKWENVPFTAEADTLQSVTDRGDVTTNSITAANLYTGGLIVGSTVYATNGLYSNSNGNLRYTFDNYDLVLRAGLATSNEYLRVFGATGNVGINTTTDAGYKLDVKGSTRVDTLTVTSATYPAFPLYIQHIGNAQQVITGGYGNEFIHFGEFGNTISIKANILYLTAAQTAISGNVVWGSGNSFTQSYFIPAGLNRGVVFSGNYTNSGAGGTFEGSNIISEANVNTSISVTSVTINQFVSSPTVNVTDGTTVLRGFYHNPTLTSTVGFTNYAFESTSGKIKVSDLAGSGARMVVADASGVLSTQAITTETDTLYTVTQRGNTSFGDIVINGKGSFTDHVTINTDPALFAGSAYNGYKVLGVGSTTGGGLSFVSNNGIAAEVFGDNGPTGLYLASYGTLPVITFFINYSEAGRFSTNSNFLVGTTTDSGYKLNINGTSYISGAATFGNGFLLDLDGVSPRLFAGQTIKYQSNSSTSQHLFGNDIGAGLTGASSALVTFRAANGGITLTSGLAIATFLGDNNQEVLRVETQGLVNIPLFATVGTSTPNAQTRLTVMGSQTYSKSIVLDSTWNYQTSWAMRNGIYSTEFNLGGSTKSSNEGGPGSLQISTYNSSTNSYKYPITFFANGNVAFAGSGASVPSDTGYTVQIKGSLELQSTTSGFLPPRMTAAQRAAIASPATGLVVYQTDGAEGLYIKLASGWKGLVVA